MLLGVPRLGIYSDSVRTFFNDLGLEVVMPKKVTSDIVKLGVMNSSDFICFPYKVTLAQHIYNLEHGATDLIMFNTQGDCRFKHYYRLQELTLQQLGYNFTMRSFTYKSAIPHLIKLVGFKKLPLALNRLMKLIPTISELEQKAYPDNGNLRIGIIGEIFTIIERDINFDMINKLQKMGVTVDVSIRLSNFIKHIFFDHSKRAEKKEARKLLPEKIGGHGFNSIYNTIWYGKNGFDGIIHLLPLSCMPESTVEIIVDQVAEKYNVPLYRFPIDEASFEVGISTRLETFVSMLKRRKK